jgi:hypothetical protein
MKLTFAIHYGDEAKYSHYMPPSEIWPEPQDHVDIRCLHGGIDTDNGSKGTGQCSALPNIHLGFEHLGRT